MKETDIKYALNREYAPKPDVKAEWEQLSGRLGIRPAGSCPRGQRRAMTLSFLSGVAATVAVFFLLSLFSKWMSHPTEYVFTANDDPQVITLAEEGGAARTMPEKPLALNKPQAAPVVEVPKMLTLTTPRGKDYQMTLADGTRVWMNADSRLEFPERFTGKERRVRLKGEAYFEVAKDESHPFIVQTDYFSTRVLGTTFNVCAYSERNANVVLVEGSVRLSSPDGKKTQLLEPGQLSTYNAQRAAFTVSEVDTYPYTQWREGFFYFNNGSLYEIMQALGHWYNVNIAFDEPDMMNVRLHFVAKRSNDISEAVRNLNALDVVKVAYEEGVVTIK